MKALQELNRFLIKYKWRLLLGVFFVITANFVSIFSIGYVGSAINSVETLLNNHLSHQSEDSSVLIKSLLITSLLFIGFKLLSGILTVGTRQMFIVVSRYIEFDLKNEIFKQYQKLTHSFYKKNKTGDLMNRITEDVAFVRMYLGPGIMYPIDLGSRTIIIFVFMVNIDWELTLFTLLPLPFLSILIYKVADKINKKSMDVQKQQSEISSTVQDTFSGIRVIKSFNTENFVTNRYDKDALAYEEKAVSLAQTQSFFGPLMVLVVGLSNLIILYLGGLKYMNGELSIGIVGQFFMYLNMLIWPFTSLGWVTMLIQRAEASMARINEFMLEKPSFSNTIPESTPIGGKIEFKDVDYIYDNTGIQALKNVSFKVEAGETLAILGKTGSGKSTIAMLVAQVLRPTAGNIYYDNLPLIDLNLDSIRENIGYVPQEAFLFSDSIENNLLFGSDKKESDLAVEVAKIAAVHDNIVDFKEGYQTVIGERGVTLSGGQKQRISIARALAHDPNILIFDDSLSAVDTETEEEILANLENATKRKTVLIITHRISSAKNANQIIILDEGKIVERGTHEDLLALGGQYYELYRKQALEKV